ncbi:hypothetical protein ES703_88962 [subsurface metagenome]
MKRYNIHLDPEWVKILDEITKEAQKLFAKEYLWSRITRADIIRVGLSIAFNLEQTYIHHAPKALTPLIKHIIRKRANRRGV